MKIVYIGNAVGDEHGKASGGEAGNQNGRELRTQPWYLDKRGWVVLRPKDKTVAEKLVYDMKAACNNMYIGYDQGERNTLAAVASKVGYDCAKVKTPCECDCSSLSVVCVRYAGINVSSFNTATAVKVLMATGKFIELTDAKYTEQSAYLMAGDILVTRTKGHMAIVLNDGDKAEHDPEPEPQPEPHVTLLGDANCDGVISAADAALILRYVAGLSTLSEQGVLNADANQDGNVDEADADAILNYLVGLDTLPPSVPAQYVYVKGGSVNVRAGDNADAKLIGVAHRGEQYKYLGTSLATGWYNIDFKSKSAWISNRADLTELR